MSTADGGGLVLGHWPLALVLVPLATLPVGERRRAPPYALRLKPVGSPFEVGAREDATLGEALAVLAIAVEVRAVDGEVRVPRPEPAIEAEEPA